MRNLRAFYITSVAIGAVTGTIMPALADAIDGRWCSGDGRQLSINGEYVTTPGGSEIMGDYDRHHYIFTVPASEPDAGKHADLVLVDDNTVHMRLVAGSDGPRDTKLQVWWRCNDPVS